VNSSGRQSPIRLRVEAAFQLRASSYLATSPDVATITGAYLDKCRLETPSRAAQDDLAADRPWDETPRLAGVG
jgi:hypothetical protein